MKNRIKKTIVMLSATTLLCACTKEEKTPVVTSSENAVSLNAVSVSINNVRYTELEFEVPEKFVASEDNSEIYEMYASPLSTDHSYITYSRKIVSAEDDYSIFTTEDMQDALKSLSGNTAVSDFSNEYSEEDGYRRIKAEVVIRPESDEYHMTEYIYVTDNFVFTLIYMLDTGAEEGWSAEFEKSMSGIELK
ncbi:MAG: hypothetical protein K6C99_10335 [Lachnospiraceae bacterium]|nr:hypothetical protein [Lachnospiraceae bacterium]